MPKDIIVIYFMTIIPWKVYTCVKSSNVNLYNIYVASYLEGGRTGIFSVGHQRHIFKNTCMNIIKEIKKKGITPFAKWPCHLCLNHIFQYSGTQLNVYFVTSTQIIVYCRQLLVWILYKRKRTCTDNRIEKNKRTCQHYVIICMST